MIDTHRTRMILELAYTTFFLFGNCLAFRWEVHDSYLLRVDFFGVVRPLEGISVIR